MSQLINEEKFLTLEESERLLSKTENVRHRVLILLMLDAGLRVSEAISLRWSNVDFKRKLIKVVSLKKRGKPDESREIPMSERIYDAFAKMVEKRGREAKGYIFEGNTTGKSITRAAVNKMLNDISSDNPELPHIHPHMLRHTFATSLRANGAELADIKDALGHEKLETSFIYAHADREKLREKINLSAPKPSLLERLKTRFFPQKKTVISLVTADRNFLVGRETEIRLIEMHLNKGVSVILTGTIGIGKSHLMNNLKFSKKVLEIDDAKEFKKSIAGALLHVYGDKETVAEMIYGTTDPNALSTKVSRESLISLCQLLISATEKGEYILKINDLDQITPTVVKALEVLKDHFTILTSARSIKMKDTPFLWNFEKIELKPLSRPDSLRLFHRFVNPSDIQNLEFVQNKIYDTSAGNPRMIVELSERLQSEPIINAETADEICGSYLGKQTQEIDLSPYLLIGFGSLMILRYIGRESGEKGLQLIGGCVMVVLLFARFFFRKARRMEL